jgi:hypothetical protein
VIAGDEVLYTKTLTTPFDLSSCLFDGLTKASAVVYGEDRLAALLQPELDAARNQGGDEPPAGSLTPGLRTRPW